MPLLANFKLAAEDYFERQAHRLSVLQNRPKPPEPLLPLQPKLARVCPQPDRLAVVNAAGSPLFEAATPLMAALVAIARTRHGPQIVGAEELHCHLTSDVTLFQSICQYLT